MHNIDNIQYGNETHFWFEIATIGQFFCIYFNHIFTASEDKNALHFLGNLENCNHSVVDATTMLVTYIFFTWVLTSVCPYIVHNDRFCLILSKNYEIFQTSKFMELIN